jgi:DNA end-binding protein Ku
VIWSDEDISTGKTTHAVDILAFVEAQDMPAQYFETPYQLVPAPGGERLYTLLRETLQHTRKVGLAYVVIQDHPHLAALVPQGQTLVLNTLRCGNEADVLCALRPRQQEAANDMDDVDDIDDIRDMELALITHDGGRSNAPDGFKADIVTPDYLTEDDDDIDSALARMLRRRQHAPDGYLPRRQRSAAQPRGSRARMRSRPLS